ncbi:hypothetical protein MBLNU13_g03538t1 [Cladosporium sp. NU13]
MPSAADTVFDFPELLDQILKDVYPSDIFVLQRTNRTFRQTILRTSHLRPRRLARNRDSSAKEDADGEIQVNLNLLFASRFFLSFLFLDPFVLTNHTALVIPGQRAILHLRYFYTPASATARRLWPSDRKHPYANNVVMRKGDKMYDIAPSWAYVWLPDAVVHISLRVYRHKRKHAYTETMQLESEKAEMHSVPMALDALATRSESKWSSGKIVGNWTI